MRFAISGYVGLGNEIALLLITPRFRGFSGGFGGAGTAGGGSGRFTTVAGGPTALDPFPVDAGPPIDPGV